MVNTTPIFAKTPLGSLKFSDFVYKTKNNGKSVLDITQLSAALSSEIESLSTRLSAEIDDLDIDHITSDRITQIGNKMLSAIQALCVSLSTETQFLTTELNREIDSVKDHLSYCLDTRFGGAIVGNVSIRNSDLSLKSFDYIKDVTNQVNLKNALDEKQNKILKSPDGIIYDHITQAEVRYSGIALDTTICKDGTKMLQYPILSSDTTIATVDDLSKYLKNDDFVQQLVNAFKTMTDEQKDLIRASLSVS